MGGIGDNPECRERDPMLGRDSCRNMRFHVDRNRTCLFVKLSLGVGAGNGYVRPGNVSKRNVLQPGVVRRCPIYHPHQRLRPAIVAGIAAMFCNNATRNDARTRLKVRRQSAGNAKTQNAVAALPNCRFNRTPELHLAAAANDGYTWAGYDARFKSEACYSHKTRAIHNTQ
jgi:hypothetical protein